MLGLGMVSKAAGFGCWLFARGFGLFALVFFLGAMGEVITEARLQQQIPSNQRATILSMNRFLLGGSAIGLTLLFGGLSKIGDLT
jgi:hypothetical protein